MVWLEALKLLWGAHYKLLVTEIRNGNVEKEEKDREREKKEKWPHRDCVKKGQ